MITDLFGQTAQVLRPSKAVDGFGDSQDSWTVVPVGYYPCRLQHGRLGLGSGVQRDENMRDVTGGRWYVYLDGTADVRERDRIVVDGAAFEVLSVYPVSHPRGGIHHYAITCNTTNRAVASDG